MKIAGSQIRFIVGSILLSLVAAVVLSEVVLGTKEKYTRSSIPDYGDTKRHHPLGWAGFLKENLNIYVTDGLGGKVRWTTNSLGFRSDREFGQEPVSGVLRILSLGDSFNAGFRVGQDETLSHLQEEWINENYGPAEILVAEIEDPSIALFYLDRFGLGLKPQIVLLGITLGNDIVQAYQGLDDHGRYKITTENGQIRIEVNSNSLISFEQLADYKIPPDYLKVENSVERFVRRAKRWLSKRHLLRRLYQQEEAITSWGDRDNLSLFDPNNGFGIFADPLPPKIEEAYQRLFRIIEAFALICRQHGIIFVVQVFPQRYQVQPEDWTRAIEEYGLKASQFNLRGPNQKIAVFCHEKGIACIDPTDAMATQFSKIKKNFYLPRGDMHWNKEGHQAFFECSLPAFEELVRAGIQKLQMTSQKLSADQASRIAH